MNPEVEKRFLSEFNPNCGIVHKVCNAYFTDPEVRRDVFQEIVYQLWRSYPSFNHDSKFSTWMYKVALNTAITFAKKNNRTRASSLSISQAEHLPDHQDSILAEEKIQRLYKAIYSLSACDKAIVLLYLEDHTYEEIATVTGLTKTNVSVKLVRIKKVLEEKVKNEK